MPIRPLIDVINEELDNYYNNNYYLYHATSLSSLISILNSNKLDTNKSRFYAKDLIARRSHGVISFSGSLDFVKNSYKGDVIIVFDKNKLVNDYDLIKESSTANVMGRGNGWVDKDEYISESSIYNIKNYIVKILVKDKSITIDTDIPVFYI